MIERRQLDGVEPSPSHAAVLGDLSVARIAIVHNLPDVLEMVRDNISTVLGDEITALTIARLEKRHDPNIDPASGLRAS